METQFEIHSRLEKKHYVEYYRCIWRKRIIWVMIFGICGVVGLILNVMSWNFSDKEIRIIIQGCAVILYAVWLYFRPWMIAGKKVKQEAEFDGTETVESVTKFGDEILDEAINMKARTSYDKLKAIHISQNVIVLQDLCKIDLILDKNGFTKGTFEEFVPFIQEKCPQAKVYKK